MMASYRPAFFSACALGAARAPNLQVLALLFAALMWLGGASAVTAASIEPLQISTRNGPLVFEVEIAETSAERAKGLMYRTELAANAGMLFDFEYDQPVSMWMKNTYIPLDMLFIRSDGRVASIAEHTEPLSTRSISSGGPVRAVLELPAGTVKTRGIAVGDRVHHRMFPEK